MTIRYVFRITDFPHFVGNGIAINLVVKKTGWVTVRGKITVVSNRVTDWILAGWTVAEEIIADIFCQPPSAKVDGLWANTPVLSIRTTICIDTDDLLKQPQLLEQ